MSKKEYIKLEVGAYGYYKSDYEFDNATLIFYKILEVPTNRSEIRIYSKHHSKNFWWPKHSMKEDKPAPRLAILLYF